MPTTINGIGTHYYGKKNLLVRTAVCNSCQHVGNLSSYDTRLWFVIVFIPVFPLGRKRIIDQCESCRRHHVADADAFEQAKQLQTSAGFDLFRREPTPDAALGLHGRLLSFHEFDQAAEFRRTALERFPNHAGLRVGLATQLDQVSAYEEAAGFYESALELEPDLPAAREGAATWKMVAGDLDEARRLLDFAEAPGAGAEHNLAPIDVLAGYYQRAGRHQEALELAAHLLRELPEIGRQHRFRAFVGRSEKALGVAESILPVREHSIRGLLRAEGSEYPAWQRWAALTGLVLALLAVGLAANNEYIRRNRVLNVVNATGLPVQVSVDGAPALTVSAVGAIPVAEGRHSVRVTGAVHQTVDVDLTTGYLDRWLKKPAWVLNPGGEAVLDQATIYYAADPRPSEHQLIVGAPFTALAHVDYRLEPPPESLEIGQRNAVVEKSALLWTQEEDAEAFRQALLEDRAAAQTFAERRLRRRPGQNELLTYYAGSAQPDEAPRVEAFLKSGLDRRPVWIQWHRAYQYLAWQVGHADQLIPDYDSMVAKEPESAALIYLRARIESEPDRQESLLRRAIEVDPAQPWPYFAQGRILASRGRWDDSLKAYQKAREHKIDSDSIDEMIHTSRLGRGDAKPLVTEYKNRLATAPMDFMTLTFLGDALAASGQADQIEPEVIAWVNRVGMEAPYGSQLAGPTRASGLYQDGKLEECERTCSEPGSMSMADSLLRAQTLLALGRTKEVTENQAFAKFWDDPWNALALSLALSLDGRSKEADDWRERAAAKLESRDVESRQAAAVLRGAEPAPVADVERIVTDANEKALMFAALGVRFPAKHDEYAAAARRFNVLRKPPYQLILRATDGSTP